jgi:hypothetical protein
MNELLKALADSDREKEASAAVEAQLRLAFRRKYRRTTWPYYFAIAAAAALVFFVTTRPKPQVHPQIAQNTAVTPSLPPAPVEKVIPRRHVRRRPPPREVVTEFFPLMEDPPPFERGELLRVSMPASAMRGVGLPVSEDRLTETVQADVLVGQEGLARAIRFVRFER